jgi:hypothetical protein
MPNPINRPQFPTTGPGGPVPYHYTPEYGQEQAEKARWTRPQTPGQDGGKLPDPAPGFGAPKGPPAERTDPWRKTGK